MYHRTLQNELRALKSKNPKDYWNILNNATGKPKKQGQISLDDLMHHFEKLNTRDKTNDPQTEPLSAHDTPTPPLPLDDLFSVKEVADHIKKLKNGKAAGMDAVVNEFKIAPPRWLPLS